MTRRRGLGDILVKLGFADQETLDRLQQDLTQATKEEKWGNQLIAHGVVTAAQLKRALTMLEDLHDEDPEKRGSAACDLADQQTAQVINLADKVALKASNVGIQAEERRKDTGDQFPIVIPQAALDET